LYKYPRCKEFRTTPTDKGLCQTFNGKALEKILKPSQWLDGYLEEFDGRSIESIEQVYGVGIDNGLAFAVDLMSFKGVSRLNAKEQKLWLKVHGKGDIPVLGDEDRSSWIAIEPIEPGKKMTNMEISLNAYVIDAEDSIRSMSVEQRKCLYPDEGELHWFDYYTESNCYLDCWWNKAYDVCGCVPWHIPALHGAPTCYSLGNLCFQTIVKKYQSEENANELGCKCLPACKHVDYEISVESQYSEHIYRWCIMNDGTWNDDGPGCFEYQGGLNDYVTTVLDKGAKPKGLDRYFNLADYIVDAENILYQQDPIFDYEPYYKVDFKCNKIDDDENACSRADGFKILSTAMKHRQSDFITISMYFPPTQKKTSRSTKVPRMSFSDKVSWIGGNLGLFTGFSLLSGFEIIYWVFLKIVPKMFSTGPGNTSKVTMSKEECAEVKVDCQCKNSFGSKWDRA